MTAAAGAAGGGGMEMLLPIMLSGLNAGAKSYASGGKDMSGVDVNQIMQLMKLMQSLQGTGGGAAAGIAGSAAPYATGGGM